MRIGQLAAQVAEQQVGLLRHEQHVRPGRARDLARTRRPQSGNHPQQRTLAGAAGSGNQQPLAGLDGQREVPQQQMLAAGRQNGHPLKRQLEAVQRLDMPRAVTGVGRAAGIGLQGLGKGMQPLDAG